MAESAGWPVGVAVPVERGGTAGRRLLVEGIWRARDVAAGECDARRMLRWLGGLAAVEQEQREAARLLGARMLARAMAFRGGAAIEPGQAAALLGCGAVRCR